MGYGKQGFYQCYQIKLCQSESVEYQHDAYRIEQHLKNKFEEFLYFKYGVYHEITGDKDETADTKFTAEGN